MQILAIALILFSTRFVYVSLSAFQQKSVIANHYILIPFTCYLRCVCDYISWGLVAYTVTGMTNWVEAAVHIIFMGTGATLGCFLGMYIHNKMVE